MRWLFALEKARSTAPVVLLEVLVIAGVLARAPLAARFSQRARRLSTAAVVLALVVFAGLAADDALRNVRTPRPWDFPSFYAVADAAVHGRNFYDPNALTAVQHQLASGQSVPSEWLKERGYWYLPPSVFLIWPLGWFDFRHALVFQYATQGLLLLGSAWLLSRRLPLGGGALGFAATLLALLVFLPVQSTIFFAQIVFGCLFFLLAAEALMDRAPVLAGLCLAVGTYYKHLLLIPAAVLLVGRDRNGRIAGASALGGIVLALFASMVVLGRGILAAWLTKGAGTRDPMLAIDPVVQSLMALLYRTLHVTPRGSLLQIVTWPPFLLAAIALAVATVIVMWRAEPTPRARRLGFWLTAALAVLCYPNTLISTLALLAPIALVTYADALETGVPLPRAMAAPLLVWAVTGLFVLYAGWASLLLWVILWLRLGALGAGRTPGPVPSPQP